MGASTGASPGAQKARTYLPEPKGREELLDFAEFMRQLEAYLAANGSSRAALVIPDGLERAIPDEIFRILEQVTNALAAGEGITVVPRGMSMTTQQAADYLGISRPTLVRLLEADEIPFDKPGRHRRVRLEDLVSYEERFRARRREALRDLHKDSLTSAIQVGKPHDVKRLAEFDSE